MLVVTILFMHGGALGIQAAERVLGYETRLFDNGKVHSIDIVMDDWDIFIAQATSEEYYMADLVIDGEAYKNVGIRGKGNTSLSTVASMDSDRYSFKIEFDQYDKTKSYYGLDKLCLNNLIQDSTMMKDYLTYTMMGAFGVHAPLCSFVYITVNGEDWGLYLAVEGIEDGFLTRNYGTDHGNLYKPDSMSFGGGRGNGKDFQMEDFAFGGFAGEMPDMPSMGEGNFAMPGGMPDMENGNMPGGMPDMGNIPDMPQGNIPDGMPEDGAMAYNGTLMQKQSGGKGGFGSSLDADTVREVWDSLGLDASLLEGIDLDTITMADVQALVSTLDGETVQKLMDAVMNSDMLENMDFGNMGGGMGSADVKLQYIDDAYDSYSNIWDSAKTNITDADKDRLIDSLEKLSSYTDIEDVVDMDQVLRYFVVHNYVVNGDSYTGSMIHNYYLYEENGRLAMIPWDYNLAFGTFQGGNAQEAVNEPIDSPVSDGDDRPMWGWILSDESYTEQYHQYFQTFLDTVDVQGMIDDAYALIQPYVEKDPTKFYSTEEFETGVRVLKQFCSLRSESIQMQLKTGETVETMVYADASGITLSDMGSMNMGGGFGDGQDRQEKPEDMAAPETKDNMDMPDMEEQNGEERQIPGENVRPGENRDWQNMEVQTEGNEWILVGISALLLLIGIVVAKVYKI